MSAWLLPVATSCTFANCKRKLANVRSFFSGRPVCIFLKMVSIQHFFKCWTRPLCQTGSISPTTIRTLNHRHLLSPTFYNFEKLLFTSICRLLPKSLSQMGIQLDPSLRRASEESEEAKLNSLNSRAWKSPEEVLEALIKLKSTHSLNLHPILMVSFWDAKRWEMLNATDKVVSSLQWTASSETPSMIRIPGCITRWSSVPQIGTSDSVPFDRTAFDALR